MYTMTLKSISCFKQRTYRIDTHGFELKEGDGPAGLAAKGGVAPQAGGGLYSTTI